MKDKIYIDEKLRNDLVKAQFNEITEYHIYSRLSRIIRNDGNASVLKKIADDEKRHYDFWMEYTGKKIKFSKFKIWYYILLARLLGLTFAFKLLEKGEQNAQINYQKISEIIPGAKKIIEEEEEHEHLLINEIQEEQLNYMGSIVLGLNDALVELTGTLAGLTFALQNTQLIALAGSITGIAAAFSMAASEYLSNRSEGKSDTAIKSATYTGIAYLSTVILLVLPYLIFTNYYMCLGTTIVIAIFIIFVYNYYISVAKGFSFKRRFKEMVFLSLGVALFSFGIGILIRKAFGIEI